MTEGGGHVAVAVMMSHVMRVTEAKPGPGFSLWPRLLLRFSCSGGSPS